MNENVLNVAFLSETNAKNLYENFAHFDDVFQNIAAIRTNAITLILQHAKLRKCEFGEPQLLPLITPKSKFDAIIIALNYEITLNSTYEQLTDVIEDDDLRDLIFRLWATSNNEYIASLKQILAQEFAPKTQKQTSNQHLELNPEKFLNNYQENFNQMSQKLSDIVAGKASKDEVSALLANPNFPFFGGLAIGALTSQILAKKD